MNQHRRSLQHARSSFIQREAARATPAAATPRRTLREVEARQAVISAEVAALDGLASPTWEDVAFQGTLIQEWDALEAERGPLRRRRDDLDRILYGKAG